jgi:glycosyltransferase involved in cell wall biosynthesis
MTMNASITIRVLHVIPDAPVGSYNLFARREAASLAKVGVDVQTWYLTSRRSVSKLLRLRKDFQKVVAEFKPDLVHAQFGTVTALFCLLNSKQPLVITFRGTDLNPDPSIAKVRGLMGRTFSRIAAAGAARIICVTSGLKQRLWWGRERTIVTPSGVKMELFRPIHRDEARARVGWPADAPIVLFNAGRFPRIKRPDLAQAAFEVAKQTLANAVLVILDGTLAPDLMPLAYSAADCLLVTSDYEGSPSVVREAMACNLPIVSVEVGDVAERIRNDRSSTIVSRDPREIGAALVKVLAERKRSNGRQAVMEIAEDRVALRLRELYEQVLIEQTARSFAMPAGLVPSDRQKRA